MGRELPVVQPRTPTPELLRRISASQRPSLPVDRSTLSTVTRKLSAQPEARRRFVTNPADFLSAEGVGVQLPAPPAWKPSAQLLTTEYFALVTYVWVLFNYVSYITATYTINMVANINLAVDVNLEIAANFGVDGEFVGSTPLPGSFTSSVL